MTATEKHEWLESSIHAGKTVILSTFTRAYKVTPRTYSRFESAGHPVWKVSGESLWMASGRKYLCADGCAIQVLDS